MIRRRLQLISKKVIVCCVTETWLCTEDSANEAEFVRYGYHIYHEPRKTKRRGVAIVAKTDIKFTSLKQQNISILNQYKPTPA